MREKQNERRRRRRWKEHLFRETNFAKLCVGISFLSMENFYFKAFLKKSVPFWQKSKIWKKLKVNLTPLFREAGHPRSDGPALKRASPFVFPHKSRGKRKRGTSVTGRVGTSRGREFLFLQFRGKGGICTWLFPNNSPAEKGRASPCFLCLFWRKKGEEERRGWFLNKIRQKLERPPQSIRFYEFLAVLHMSERSKNYQFSFSPCNLELISSPLPLPLRR